MKKIHGKAHLPPRKLALHSETLRHLDSAVLVEVRGKRRDGEISDDAWDCGGYPTTPNE
jgi:hypothetical protein